MSAGKEWASLAVSNWHEINSPYEAGCVGADSRRKFIWHRVCRCHAAELTVQAANAAAFGPCIYCTHPDSLPAGWSPASEHARYAAKLVQAHPSVLLVITEAKVLNGTRGGFDFSLLLRGTPGSADERRLEIDVDGPQHFTKDMYDTTAEAQRAADARKDEAAWEQGRCMLRLHYQDTGRWARAIDRAIHLATEPSKKKFQRYTGSYAKPNRKATLQVSRAGASVAASTHVVLHWVVGVSCEGQDVQIHQASGIAGGEEVVDPGDVALIVRHAFVSNQRLSPPLAQHPHGHRAYRHAGLIHPNNSL